VRLFYAKSMTVYSGVAFLYAALAGHRLMTFLSR